MIACPYIWQKYAITKKGSMVAGGIQTELEQPNSTQQG